MTFHITTDEFDIDSELFDLHLPDEIDRELLILKGHLLIERLLDSYLTNNFENPEKYKSIRFTFAQKLVLVSAMHEDTEDDWLWSVLKHFNKMRNQLSHELEMDGLIILIAKFLGIMNSTSEFRKFKLDSPKGNNLRKAIYVIYKTLSRITDL